MIAANVESFKDISELTHGDAARAIHKDGVHVLINLNGFTRGARTGQLRECQKTCR